MSFSIGNNLVYDNSFIEQYVYINLTHQPTTAGLMLSHVINRFILYNIHMV